MHRYVLGLQEINRSQIALVGGKGAHLGELARIEGLQVPAGFCVTTTACQRIMADVPSLEVELERLSRLSASDGEALRGLSAQIRRTVAAIDIPDDLAAEITDALAQLGEQAACAVRSSATAEDSPTASFAGQHDTYLNVVGPAAILEHVRHCWASLFTERAVTYRLRNGIEHRKVHMAVIVQQMVFPRAAGVLFTADPITGNRKVAAVEASFGLGEALVSGLVNADVYKVRDGAVIARTIATKRLAIHASPAGGTQQHAIESERQQHAALTEPQVVRLAQLGRQIEAHFGRPQDIEWCLVDADFRIVQSRPITTLFPIPVAGDAENHVYVSVGHQQMMTDAMKPLGISVWQLTAKGPMHEAGGRLFVDVTQRLAASASRTALLNLLSRGDPRIGDALQSLVERGDFIRPIPGDVPSAVLPGGASVQIETDPAIAAGLIARTQDSLAALKRDIRSKSGTALLDFIRADIQKLQEILFDPLSLQVVMAGIEATWWLNERLHALLGEKNAADTLTQSVPHNVTSQMGLALMDVADAIRPHSEVVAFLKCVTGEDFLDALPTLSGGEQARVAIQAWLDEYGMRGVGEIDITRPRWSECPGTLVPLILSNIKNFTSGAAARRFAHGRAEAAKKEQELLERLRALPEGDRQADEVKRMIDRLRTFVGYREYPKYSKVCRDFVYKQALLEEAQRLVQTGVLREQADIFYLTFPELHDVVRTRQVDEQLLRQRKDAFAWHRTLTPPQILTSDGEAITGKHRRDDLPAGALVGLPVCCGTIEGRARVILDVAAADLEPGDILVTAYTDPSWTPLFVAIKGLVTEVGSLMSHGTVIAREYGLPAIVGVEHATRLIRDGQRICLHGTEGYVEILS